MKYRENIVESGRLGTARIAEDDLFTRLHFSGKLNEDCIRLFAILGVPLAVEILSESGTRLSWGAEIEMLNLDEIYRIAPGLNIPVSALAVFDFVKMLQPNRLEEICIKVGPMACAALNMSLDTIGGGIQMAGSFLSSHRGAPLQAMDLTSFMGCKELSNQFNIASKGLKLVLDLLESNDNSLYVMSLQYFCGSLADTLLSYCPPDCLDLECIEDHSSEYLSVREAEKSLFDSILLAADVTGVYDRFRDALAPYLLERMSSRI